MKTIGFIGAGNMGSALAAAVCQTMGADNVILTDKDTQKAQALATTLGCKAESLDILLAQCDVIFLGVKPQVLPTVLADITPKITGTPLFISMAAGVTLNTLGAALPTMPIIRIMPNLPVKISAGMILYTPNCLVSQDMEAAFLHMLEQAGTLDKLPEAQIDAGSAISGCGPAFVAMFAEALADSGVACGLPRNKALLYAEQTIKGTADLLLETGEHPATLKDAVCSPGGTTIEGVLVLENEGFRTAVSGAVRAAFERTKELSKR